MGIKETQEQLDVLIRARYPLIYCTSYEEARVEETLKVICQKREALLLVWTRTRGFINISNGKSFENTLTPDKALHFISEHEGKVCYLLKDFHPYLKDPFIVRSLRDLSSSIPKTRKNIVLLSPSATIPPELSKEMAIIDFPLPGKEEIRAIYDGSILSSGIKETKGVSINLDELIEAARGLTEEEVANVFAKSLISHHEIQVDEILAEKKQIVQKSGILDFIKVQKDFSAIGGLENLKAWLERRKAGFSAKARDLGLPTPKGMLLIGLPGCGKSLTAVCTSAAWKMPLLRLDMGKIFSGLVGSSEENMRAAIKTAEGVAPCILWIDEIEKGFSGQESSGSSDGGTTSRVFGTFLTWMQEKEAPVFVLATANNIAGLPPEMLRKGRFDEIFFVDAPSGKERMDIIHIHLEKRKWGISDFDSNELTKATEGFTGAELEQGIIDAQYEALFQEEPLGLKHLVSSFNRTVPLSKTMGAKIAEVREWAKDRAVQASLSNKTGDPSNLAGESKRVIELR